MFGEKHIVALVVKCLAVGGGFLAGYALGGLAAYALDRWVFGRKAPDVVKRLVRIVAGLVTAILVALFIFGDGGGDGFGGGGGGDDKGKGKQEQTTPSTTPPPVTPPQPQPQPGPVGEGEVRVTVLGGSDVKAERYYQIDRDPEPKALDDVIRELTARKAKDPKLGTVRVLAASRNPLPVTPVAHSAYTRLKTEGERVGFRVVLP